VVGGSHGIGTFKSFCGSDIIFSKNLKELSGFLCCGDDGLFFDFLAALGDISLCTGCYSVDLAVSSVYITFVVVHRLVFSLINWVGFSWSVQLDSATYPLGFSVEVKKLLYLNGLGSEKNNLFLFSTLHIGDEFFEVEWFLDVLMDVGL
jgi:hypothetical protein